MVLPQCCRDCSTAEGCSEGRIKQGSKVIEVHTSLEDGNHDHKPKGGHPVVGACLHLIGKLAVHGTCMHMPAHDVSLSVRL